MRQLWRCAAHEHAETVARDVNGAARTVAIINESPARCHLGMHSLYTFDASQLPKLPQKSMQDDAHTTAAKLPWPQVSSKWQYSKQLLAAIMRTLSLFCGALMATGARDR
jgi:hypothetical protein